MGPQHSTVLCHLPSRSLPPCLHLEWSSGKTEDMAGLVRSSPSEARSQMKLPVAVGMVCVRLSNMGATLAMWLLET